MLSVIVPALNEEESIGKVILLAKKSLRGTLHEIIVVDGESSDKTREVSKKAGARVVVEKRRGYGKAYLRGISVSRGDYLALIDGDGTYPSEKVGQFFRELEESGKNFLLASRFSGKIVPGAMSPANRFGNFALTALTNFLFSDALSDSQSGFRIYRKSDLKRMHLSSGGMEFTSELNCEGRRLGLSRLEVPIVYSKRKGRAKLNPIRDGLRHLVFLLGRRFGAF